MQEFGEEVGVALGAAQHGGPQRIGQLTTAEVGPQQPMRRRLVERIQGQMQRGLDTRNLRRLASDQHEQDRPTQPFRDVTYGAPAVRPSPTADRQRRSCSGPSTAKARMRVATASSTPSRPCGSAGVPVTGVGDLDLGGDAHQVKQPIGERTRHPQRRRMLQASQRAVYAFDCNLSGIAVG